MQHVEGLKLRIDRLRAFDMQHGSEHAALDTMTDVCGVATDADAPFRFALDAVTSSIGLVVITPLNGLVAEIARVLRPGGILAAIAPALRPLSPSDARILARINTRLRAKPQFPGPVELAGFTKTLHAYGLRRVGWILENTDGTTSSRAMP